MTRRLWHEAGGGEEGVGGEAGGTGGAELGGGEGGGGGGDDGGAGGSRIGQRARCASIAAAKRLFAAVIAWMSPVMCRLNSSIGAHCE